MSNLSVGDKIGYGVGSAAYILGGSVAVGVARTANAIYHLVVHSMISYQLTAVADKNVEIARSVGKIISEEGEIWEQDGESVLGAIFKKVGQFVDKAEEVKAEQWDNKKAREFVQMQEPIKKHWRNQLLRGLSEVFFPIIAPSIWTIRDFTSDAKEITEEVKWTIPEGRSQNLKKAIYDFGGNQTDFLEPEYTFSKNFLGLRENQHLRAWDAKMADWVEAHTDLLKMPEED